MNPEHDRRGRFTLIELLVVVSIIAILAAMLLPALSKARTIVKLTVCSNNLRQIGLGVFAYGAEQDDYYPLKTTSWQSTANRPWTSHPVSLTNFLPDGVHQRNDRPRFREIFGDLSLFHCPLLPNALDLDAVPASVGINYAYELYFGRALSWTSRDTNMYRVGQRPALPGGEVLTVLAADAEWYPGWSSVVYTSHPDNTRTLLPFTYQDANEACVYWYRAPAVRGKIERNFLRDDGSVARVNGLVLNDPRMVNVRHLPHAGTTINGRVIAGEW